MRVLVDTHAFVWELLNDNRSSRKAKQILADDNNELFFSLASLWEIAIKMRLGKIEALGSSVAYIRERMERYSMQLLPIRYEHVLQMETSPAHHGDPFDRMLVAQALTESLPILSSDKVLGQYPAKLLW